MRMKKWILHDPDFDLNFVVKKINEELTYEKNHEK